jgi:hypothetical protein
MAGPVAQREGVANLRDAMGLSERRACTLVDADRTMIRRQSRRPPESSNYLYSADPVGQGILPVTASVLTAEIRKEPDDMSFQL